jgi:hypothetical protein
MNIVERIIKVQRNPLALVRTAIKEVLGGNVGHVLNEYEMQCIINSLNNFLETAAYIWKHRLSFSYNGDERCYMLQINFTPAPTLEEVDFSTKIFL